MSMFHDPDPDAADVVTVRDLPKLKFYVLHDHALLLPDIMTHPGPKAEAPIHDIMEKMFHGWDPVKAPTEGPANRVWEMEQREQRIIAKDAENQAIKLVEEALEAVEIEEAEPDKRHTKSHPGHDVPGTRLGTLPTLPKDLPMGKQDRKEPVRYQEYKSRREYVCGTGCGDPIEKGTTYRQRVGQTAMKFHVECWIKYFNVAESSEPSEEVSDQ